MFDVKQKIRLYMKILGCCIVFGMLQYLIICSDRMGYTAYNGVLMVFQFVMCLIMVHFDYIVGIRMSYLLMGFAIINAFMAMLRMHSIGPLPGLFNIILYTLTLTIISRQFRIRDKEAITDFLTGVYDRRGLYKVIQELIIAKNPFHVVYIDLGNFKFVNDNYGHAYGDSLIKCIADQLNEFVGKMGTIARIDGEEFVLVLDGKCDAFSICEQALDIICAKKTLMVDGVATESYLTAYAGISEYPVNGTDAETLIKCADIAMYEASKDKANRICFFDGDMQQALERQIELEKLIKEGLEQDYFYMVYQPQYCLNGKKLRGFESLLRMKAPDGTFVSPAEFIPVAEKADLILKIDDYVLNRVMNEYRDIVMRTKESLIISVNVSAKNIGALDFVDKIQQIIQTTRFPAKNLEIEITEYCLVQSVETTIENIKKLRAMGIRVALDDFGTGYTSLSYLAKMPINLLKVDKSLVDDIETNQKSRDFVNAVISMGHMMGCEVISEGVENEKQLELLTGQKCDFVQGYVWGRPLDYKVAKELSLGAE